MEVGGGGAHCRLTRAHISILLSHFQSASARQLACVHPCLRCAWRQVFVLFSCPGSSEEISSNLLNFRRHAHALMSQRLCGCQFLAPILINPVLYGLLIASLSPVCRDLRPSRSAPSRTLWPGPFPHLRAQQVRHLTPACGVSVMDADLPLWP